MADCCYGPMLGKIRRAKKIKAARIARRLGISSTTYSQIENGRRSASFERVNEICSELGLTLTQFDELLQENGNNVE